MINMSHYKNHVHRSLLQRELLGGIPQAGFMILIFIAVIFIYGLRINIAIVPIVILYFVMRTLTKHDPWFIDIVLDNIMQKDKLIP